MKHNVLKTALLLLLSFCLLLPSVGGCAGTDPAAAGTSEEASTEPQTEPLPAETVLRLMEGGQTAFKIVRSENADNATVTNVVSFRKHIREATGIDYEIETDWVKERNTVVENDDYEILLGKTNRKESVDTLEEIGRFGYAIRIVGKKLVVIGTDAAYLAEAMKVFFEEVLDNPEKCTADSLTVGEENCHTVQIEKKIGLADVLDTGEKYTVTLTQVIHAAKIGDYCVGQGAASDGTYAYFVLRTPEDGDARIAKYELETGKFVAASEPVHVYHGNDMTYCKSQNLLYLVHGSSEGKILTTMDPDTLTVVKEKVAIPVGAGALTYSWAQDLFAVSQGGKSLYTMTPDYKLKYSGTRNPTSGYTAQGMGSDEKYIYFPMSGSNDNILMTYTWDGKYVTDVHLPTTTESESMFWVNDTYYVNFYKSRDGAFLYRLDVIPVVE